ncbi:MAG: O-antigen ligase family protein [Chlamydiae bacterium]|nr:O-antigen ligase family protein [Chlamydiota bacterium]MBI3277293.1 O-antigen ligase family protein [Chlamydiota bacterium]
MVILRPLVSGLVYPNSNYLFLISALFLGFVGCLRSIFLGKFLVQKSVNHLFHLIFLILFLLSWFHSQNIQDGIQFFLNVATALLIYFLVVHVFEDERDLLKLIGTLLVTGGIVSFYGLYQSFFGLAETRQYVMERIPLDQLSQSFRIRLASPRIFSTLIYPNALAGYLLTLLPLSLSAFGIRNRRFKWVVMISIAFFGAVIFLLFEKPLWIWVTGVGAFVYPLLYFFIFFLSFSKGGLVVFFFVRLAAYLILFFRLNLKPPFRKRFFWSVFILETLIIFFFLIKGENFTLGVFKSSSARYEYWKAAFKMVHDFPLWGSGPGTFGSVYAHYKLPGAEETRMAHNNFLQVTSELGLLGGIVFLLIWCFPMVTYFCRTVKREKVSWIGLGAFLGILGFSIHSLIDFDLYEPSIALNAWTLLAILHQCNLSKKSGYTFQISTSLGKMISILLSQAMVILLLLVVRNFYVADGLFQQAQKVSLEKDWALTLDFLNESIEKNPLNAQAYFLKGSILQIEKNEAKAIQYYGEACQKDPFNPAYPYRLALLFKQSKEKSSKEIIQEAEFYFKKAIENYPTHPQLHFALAQFYESIGRAQQALLEYRKVREFGGDALEVRKRMRKLKKEVGCCR